MPYTFCFPMSIATIMDNKLKKQTKFQAVSPFPPLAMLQYWPYSSADWTLQVGRGDMIWFLEQIHHIFVSNFIVHDCRQKMKWYKSGKSFAFWKNTNKHRITLSTAYVTNNIVKYKIFAAWKTKVCSLKMLCKIIEI